MSSRSRGEQLTREATIFYLKLLAKGGKLLFQPVAKRFGLSPRQTTNLAHYLRRQKFISGSPKTGYSITPSGLEHLNALQLKTLATPNEWDGKWRLILFDIPESKRELRNKVRSLLKEFNCQQLQKSVWVHAFDCLDQFRQIRQAYGEQNDLIVFELARLENNEELVKTFQKLYPEANFN